jgi:hypothetical protein
MGQFWGMAQKVRQDNHLQHLPAVRRPKLGRCGLRGAVKNQCFLIEKPCQDWVSGFCQQDGSKIAAKRHDHASGRAMLIGMEQKYLQPAIRGKIADLLDYPVVSARVVLSGAKLEEKLCAVTGVEGLFMFNRIPPGSYTLEVIYSGFSKLVQRGIAVRDHAITGLDLKMDFLEDSRTIKLRAMSLEFINDQAPAADTPPPMLALQLSEVMTGLVLDRVLFNPPPVLKIGRSVSLELGVYQNLKGEVMRRLLERSICRFDRDHIEVTLKADLQVAGCQVLLLGAAEAAIDGASYLDWEWEILPEISGLGLISLRLETSVRFIKYGVRKKCLLTMDRDVMIKENHWFSWRRFL